MLNYFILMTLNLFTQNNTLVGFTHLTDEVIKQPTGVSNFMEEIKWKPVVGWEGYYEVSNTGLVKSLERIDLNNHLIKSRVLKVDTHSRYHRVTLCVDKRKKRESVHRLVAFSFIINTHHKPCINHINGDKLDNRVENLEWCTFSENSLHAVRTGLMPPNKASLGKTGLLSPRSKKIIQCDASGDEIKKWDGMLDAQRGTGVKSSNISKVCCGIRKLAGGFKWKYA